MDFILKGSRLRALTRLLDYARAESEELALAVPAKLLAAAVLAVSDELENLQALSHKEDGSRQTPLCKQ